MTSKATDKITIEVTDTYAGASHSDLNDVLGKTAAVVTASISGNQSQVNTTNLSNMTSTDVIDLTVSDTYFGTAADDAHLKALKALRDSTNGKISATVTATLAKVTDTSAYTVNTKATDDIDLTITDTKVTSLTKLKTVAGLTAKPVVASAEFNGANWIVFGKEPIFTEMIKLPSLSLIMAIN